MGAQGFGSSSAPVLFPYHCECDASRQPRAEKNCLMSVLTAAKRAATRAAAVQSPYRVARRHLGDGVRGPEAFDVPGNLKYAKEFFTKGSVSYMEYKQQCIGLRLFAVPGVTLLCVLLLAMDPPKSSYWQRYSPGFLFQNVKSLFFGSAPPMFLVAKAEHEADAPAIVKELIMNRRLAGADGSSSEDEH